MDKSYFSSIQMKNKAVYFFLKKMKYHNNAIDLTKLGKKNRKRITVNQIYYHTELMQFYAEAYFFEVCSLLDILLKSITCSNDDSQLSFSTTSRNGKDLSTIVPQDSYIIHLKKFYDNGHEQSEFSIKNLKKYRNLITHQAYLNKMIHLRYSLSWKETESSAMKILPLPDNPHEKDPSKWTFNKKITLLDFCIKIDEIIQLIIRETDKNVSKKYGFRDIGSKAAKR